MKLCPSDFLRTNPMLTTTFPIIIIVFIRYNRTNNFNYKLMFKSCTKIRNYRTGPVCPSDFQSVKN